MINENNKIVKTKHLGGSDDFSESYFKHITENGEVWYSGSVMFDGGPELMLPYTQTPPRVAMPDLDARWIDTQKAMRDILGS